MKQLGNSPEAQWNSSLVDQLGFIKRHLRYPISRRTAAPLLFVAGVAPALAFVFYTVVFTKSTGHYHSPWIIALVIVPIVVVPLVAARRYLSTLRFVTIPASPLLAENMWLLQQFLQSNHFAYARHPQAPEVFQMISKSLSGLQGEREVVVFIADEGRILVNSHFTQSKLRSPVGEPHYKEMARMLSAWIKQQGAAYPPDGNALQRR